jgi:hypothetical protein
MMKPKEDDAGATGGVRRRARSLGLRRKVDKLRAELDSRENDANRAKGMTIQARALMNEGKTEEATLMLHDAKQLASSHIPQRSGGYAQGTTAAQATLQQSQRQLALKAQILALASSSEHKEAPERPLRLCEEEELRRSQEAVNRQVYSAVESCDELESELRRQRRHQASEEERAFRFSSPEDVDDIRYGSPKQTRFNMQPGSPKENEVPKFGYTDSFRDSRTLANNEGPIPMRLQMCVEFLDTKSCSKGENCPFAHQPSELRPRPFDSMNRLLNQ